MSLDVYTAYHFFAAVWVLRAARYLSHTKRKQTHGGQKDENPLSLPSPLTLPRGRLGSHPHLSAARPE